MRCYTQSEADKEEERISPFCCVSLLENEKRSDESEMQWSLSATFFHPICISLAMVRISYGLTYILGANCWISCKDCFICSTSSVTGSDVISYIKTLYQSPVFRLILRSPVKACLCDISFSKHSITAKIIHPLDMSHTQTKLYLLLNHISDGAALLENCMLCVWFMSQHI